MTSDKTLLEPFHQDLSLQQKRDTSPSPISLQMRGDPASTKPKEKSTTTLIEPLYQDLITPKQTRDRTITNSTRAREEEILSYNETESSIHHDSSGGESVITLPEQWKRSRMRRKDLNKTRSNERRNGETHHRHSREPSR